MNKYKKIYANFLFGAIIIAPIAMIACSSNKDEIVASSTENDIKHDKKAMGLMKKEKYENYSKNTIRLVSNKTEQAKSINAAVKEFNKVYGTNLKYVISGSGEYKQFIQSISAADGITKNHYGLFDIASWGDLYTVAKYMQPLEPKDFGIKNVKSQPYKYGNYKANISPSRRESMGTIYNKKVFRKWGIKVHEGKKAPNDASDNDKDGLVPDKGDIKDVYSADLTYKGFSRLATYLNGKDGLNGFESTSRSSADTWPYARQVLESSVNVNNIGEEFSEKMDVNKIWNQNVVSSIAGTISFFQDQNHGQDEKIWNVQKIVQDLAVGRTAMIQQGTWEYNLLKQSNPNLEVGFLPAISFISKDGKIDEKAKAKFYNFGPSYYQLTTSIPEEQKTIKMFLEWSYTTTTGLRATTNDFSSITPYPIPSDVQVPKTNNQLVNSALNYNKPELNIDGKILYFPAGFPSNENYTKLYLNNDFKTNNTKIIEDMKKLWKESKTK